MFYKIFLYISPLLQKKSYLSRMSLIVHACVHFSCLNYIDMCIFVALVNGANREHNGETVDHDNKGDATENVLEK